MSSVLSFHMGSGGCSGEAFPSFFFEEYEPRGVAVLMRTHIHMCNPSLQSQASFLPFLFVIFFSLYIGDCYVCVIRLYTVSIRIGAKWLLIQFFISASRLWYKVFQAPLRCIALPGARGLESDPLGFNNLWFGHVSMAHNHSTLLSRTYNAQRRKHLKKKRGGYERKSEVLSRVL